MGKSPETSSSLNARTLLIHQIDDFHKKEFEIEGDIQVLWGILDIYLQRLEPVIGFIPTESDPIAPLNKHSALYRKARTELFLNITRTSDFDIQKLKTIQVDTNGILSLNYNTGKKIQINMVDTWNNILLPKPSVTPIVQKAREQEARLHEQINKESYFGGSVIVEYMPAAIVGTTSAVALGQAIKGPSLAIKSIMIRTESGQLMAVKIDQIYTGSKEVLQNSLMKILQSAGYLFDVGKKLFFDPVARTLIEGVDSLRSMSYDQWKRIPGNEKISEIDFKKYKEEFFARGKPAFDLIGKGVIPAGKVLGTVAGYVSENAMHLFFLPVFFQKFSKYQNSVTFLQGASEMALFTAGAKYLPQAPKAAFLAADGLSGFVNGTKVGTKIAEGVNKIPMPKVLRPILGTIIPLGAGGLSVVGGDLIAQEYLDATRTKWRHFNGNGIGSQYTDGYSAIGHATGFGITDALHQINKFARWANDEDEWDLGIPRIEVPLWKGKYLMTIPEISWFQDKINFGTNPWEWIRGAAGRDIDTWNSYVDLYRPRVKKAIYDLLGKYARDESMFSDQEDIKKEGGKDKLLEKHLIAILESGSTGTGFNSEKNGLIEAIITEAPNVIKSNGPTRILDSIIDNKVEMMKVDTFFITERSKALELRKGGIEGMIDQLPIDEKSKKYAKTIASRMIKNQPLFAPDINMDKKVGKQELRNRVPSEENNLFHQILDNDTPIVIEGKTIKTGEYFSIILDSILDWKRENEFLTEIGKGNKKGVQWTL